MYVLTTQPSYIFLYNYLVLIFTEPNTKSLWFQKDMDFQCGPGLLYN